MTAALLCFALSGQMAPTDGWHQPRKRRYREWASYPCSNPGVGLVGPPMLGGALGVGTPNGASSLVVVDAIPCSSLGAYGGSTTSSGDDEGVGDDSAVLKLHPAVEELLLNISGLLPDAQRQGYDSNDTNACVCTDDGHDHDNAENNNRTITIQCIKPGHVRVGRFATKQLTEQKNVPVNQKVCVDLRLIHSDSDLFRDAIVYDCYKDDDAKMCVSGVPISYMDTMEQMGGVGVHRHRALLFVHHSLSGRLVAWGSYVVIALPPIWSSDAIGVDSWDISSDPTSSLEADSDEVAIFQVESIQVIGENDFHEDMPAPLVQQPAVLSAYADHDDEVNNNENSCYRLINFEGSPKFSIRVFYEDAKAISIGEVAEEEMLELATGPNCPQITSCPGYEGLLNELLRLAQIQHPSAAPSGVILTGCTGVGKSRMASCLADRLLEQDEDYKPIVRRVSAKDILLAAASHIDVKMLIDHILGPAMVVESMARRVLIIDDLDTVIDLTGEETSAPSNPEIVLAVNAIVGAIDLLVMGMKDDTPQRPVTKSSVRNASTPFILGLCCCSSEHIPANLVRVGRFEKIAAMAPPTQHQREKIFQSMLESLPLSQDGYDKQELAKKWAMALAPQTAGFVASDVRRVCADALTRSQSRYLCSHSNLTSASLSNARIVWNDVRESARVCVPSQLARLDVTSTSMYTEQVPDAEVEIADSSKLAHEKAWSTFGGYQEMKKRVYRTVVSPWMHERIRQEEEALKTLSNKTDLLGASLSESTNDVSMRIPPPSGILFYGLCGVGKSMAAQCLASSMSLPVVKVAASDVLDQWLGGSEAAIRSLFARARSASPCVLLFDDIDAIASNRDDDDGDSTNVQSRILSTLLNEMDGVSSHTNRCGVLVVATTNRLSAIDSALLRPGRLEEHIELGLPSAFDIEEMLRLHLAKSRVDDDVDTCALSRRLESVAATGADVEGICTGACLRAIRRATEGSFDESDAAAIGLGAQDFRLAFQAINAHDIG